MSTKAERKELHQKINALSKETVARILRDQVPDVKGKDLEHLAKRVISAAHEQVSPKKKRPGLDGALAGLGGNK